MKCRYCGGDHSKPIGNATGDNSVLLNGNGLLVIKCPKSKLIKGGKNEK